MHKRYLLGLAIIYSVFYCSGIPVFAETELYKKSYKEIILIPVTEADESECIIFRCSGFALRISDDITIIGMKLFREDPDPSFKIGLKFACSDSHYRTNVELFIDGKKMGILNGRVGDFIYFDFIPNRIIIDYRHRKLELKVICTKKKVWYTGEKITKNWLGVKLKRPKFKGGEWKSELIEKKEEVFGIEPDYIRALLDRMNNE